MSDAAAIIDSVLGNGAVIVDAANKAGLDLALGAALVEQESGGRSIFGCDAGDVGDTPPYCHQRVTKKRVAALRGRTGDYPHGTNGVGLTQLTYPALIEQAEALGGAHLPKNQCVVGFGLLQSLLGKYPYLEALAAYNAGETNRKTVLETYAKPLAAKHEAWKQRLGGDEKVVTGQDLVDAARLLLGAPYRLWYSGALIPMWLADAAGDPPPVAHLKATGLNCSDLINAALELNGLPAIGGTRAWYDYLYDSSSWFDLDSPGEVGAVAIQNYVDESNQGHIVLYTGEHSIIQSITTDGVTEAYTDQQTYLWPECQFQIYGRIPGVDYSGSSNGKTPAPYVAIDAQGYFRLNGPDWSGGWYDENWTLHES